MDPLILAPLSLGLVLFLALLGLTAVVERTSTAESAGRSASASARTTAPLG